MTPAEQKHLRQTCAEARRLARRTREELEAAERQAEQSPMYRERLRWRERVREVQP